MQKELSEKYNNFHDGKILKNTIDFENRKTEIIIEGCEFIENSSLKRYKLEFINIEWQNFEFFNKDNGIFEIDFYKNYKEFRIHQREYLANMEKYFTSGTFEKIEHMIDLKFFFITSTTNGLDGFIICESLFITEI